MEICRSVWGHIASDLPKTVPRLDIQVTFSRFTSGVKFWVGRLGKHKSNFGYVLIVLRLLNEFPSHDAN